MKKMRTRKQPTGEKNLVGQRVEQRRKELFMKQKDLLAKLQILGVDMNASGLSKLEGQIRHVNDFELIALSKALEIPVDDLLGIKKQ